MNIGFAIALILGVIVLLAVVTWIVVWWERNNEDKEIYDERQQIMHGRAYRLSCWTGSIYCFFLMIYLNLASGEGAGHPQPWVLLFLGIMITWLTYHLYCLMTHAALPVGTKPGGMAINYAALALMQGMFYFKSSRRWGSEMDESIAWLCLIGMIGFGFLSLCYIVLILWKDRE